MLAATFMWRSTSCRLNGQRHMYVAANGCVSVAISLERPMALAYHIVYCTYGFWLPNDPRGSWSTIVGGRRLYERFGPATKVATSESLAHRQHDHRLRLAAKHELNFPPTVFTSQQALDVGLAIGEVVEAKNLTALARAVMAEHVHLVMSAGNRKPGCGRPSGRPNTGHS